MILKGEKIVTWRLFDDKDLQIGDELKLVNSDTKEKFANAKIINVYEKKLGAVEASDYDGHEKYASNEEMIETFKTYYGDKVNANTIVKIIKFKLG